MGTKGRAIVGLDVDELLKVLNQAFADEWLAYYQYWLGAKLAVGPMREGVMAELIQHATDELRHAQMIADRIIQLKGTPVLEPKAWYDATGCGYVAPTDPYVKTLLEQNIKGEQCAIAFYSKLANMTRDKDPVTYNIAVQILSDEVEHEEDLQAIEEDIETMMSRH